MTGLIVNDKCGGTWKKVVRA